MSDGGIFRRSPILGSCTGQRKAPPKMGKVSETYKARDVEEIVDIYLYRPWGYALAVGAHKLKMTPNQISIIGMGVGIISGLLFIPQDPWVNAAGVFMWMLGQALDGADGQLARLANMKSRLGRMLDGISRREYRARRTFSQSDREIAEAGERASSSVPFSLGSRATRAARELTETDAGETSRPPSQETESEQK